MIDNSFQSFLHCFYGELGGPVAGTAKALLEAGQWDALVSLRVDPRDYDTVYNYAQDVAASDLIRKCSGLPTSIDLKAAAIRSFHECEKACMKTNLRLQTLFHQGLMSPEDEPVRQFFDDIRKDIGDLLGNVPATLSLRHGPGATFRDRGRNVSIGHKMSSQPTMTLSMTRCLAEWSNTAWRRGLLESHPDLSDPEVVPGNRFVTVKKDSTKDRGIAIEPSLNVAYQLAVGRHMRKVLLKWGIDLNNGQKHHQLLAKLASVLGHLITVDLSSASDMIAKLLVQLCCPVAWFDLLNSLRSPKTQIGDNWYLLEKFSSMGNGFTFELETMIFAALIRGLARLHGLELTPETFGVFGDDIICPVSLSKHLFSLLSYCGLKVNTLKSFTEGDFRESCGGDFYKGVAVRPHYIKEIPNAPQDWISVHNGLCRLEQTLGPDSLQKSKAFCIAQVPTAVRKCCGPHQLGDLVFQTASVEWNVKIKHGIRKFRCYRPITEAIPWDLLSGPHLAVALYGGESVGYVPRGMVSGYRTDWVSFS